ncbi:MAG: hypothetical protein ACMXYK_02775 [Candidatus Woesearchaeota archaeon]
MNKKAQTATEYLIILAVVIVIALVVVGLLGGFPGIGSGIGSNVNVAYWSTTDLTIGTAVLPAGEVSNLTLVIGNNMPGNIRIDAVQTTFTVGPNSVASIYNQQSGTVRPGSTHQVTLINATGNQSWSNVLSGTTYSFDVLINYTDLTTSAQRTFVGERRLDVRASN